MNNSGFAWNIFEKTQPCLGSDVLEDATIGLRSPLIKTLILSVKKMGRKGRERKNLFNNDVNSGKMNLTRNLGEHLIT